MACQILSWLSCCSRPTSNKSAKRSITVEGFKSPLYNMNEEQLHVLKASILFFWLPTPVWLKRGAHCQSSLHTEQIPAHRIQNICMTFVQCWTNVEDVGPTLYKCYTNVLGLLGVCIYSRRLSAAEQDATLPCWTIPLPGHPAPTLLSGSVRSSHIGIPRMSPSDCFAHQQLYSTPPPLNRLQQMSGP